MKRLSDTYYRLTGFLLLLTLFACSKDPIGPLPADGILSLSIPDYFPEPNYRFENNVLSRKRLDLGRQLFYDPILSSDSTISCASCHHRNAAFSDPGKAFSTGVQQAIGKRNSPALFNLLWNTSFMWDGGVNHLEIMPFSPINQVSEMNQDMTLLMRKLNGNATYRNKFREAFGVDSISTKPFFYALAQFMGSLISAGSKYDQMRTGQLRFSETESAGYALFKAHCKECHQEPLFTTFQFENNGLDATFTDSGRYRITQQEADLGKFKIPSLRNVFFTAPYMHDGRFTTIEAVMNHYQNGIKTSPTLSPVLQQGIAFTEEERQSLIAFLRTLSDSSFVSNPAHSNPF